MNTKSCTDTMKNRSLENLEPRIVFVQLGPAPTRWLIPNVVDHSKRFNENVVVVTDQMHLVRELGKRGVDTFLARKASYEDVNMHPGAQGFRRGFWMHTFQRFFALQAFQEDCKCSLVHLESDVVLSSSCNLASFGLANKSLQYPLLTDNDGIGSVFFSSNSESLAHFNDYLRAHIIRVRNGTDMGALYGYARDFPDRVGVLPTLIPDAKNNLQVALASDLRNRMSEGINLYGGIFDGATIGQYLFGLDPRNQHGRRIQSTSPPDHILDASKYRYRLIDGEVHVSSSESALQYCVLNFHVHSKDLRAMEAAKRAKLSDHRIRKLGTGPYSEFSWWGFVSWVKELVRRRSSQFHR